MRILTVGLIAVGALLGFATASPASEIATAMDVDPSAIVRVSGSARTIISGNRVSQGDVIQTRRTGQVQLLFDDNTRIVVGPNSRLVIENVLMKSKRTAGRFTVSAVKGSFRFISGRSSKSAYEIRTPTATMGVRGTAFDFAVNRGRETDLAVLHGRVRFCGSSGNCQEVRGGCSLIYADRRGRLNVPRTPEEGANRISDGFPYLLSQRTLVQGFRASTGGCARYLKIRPGSRQGGSLQRINTPAPVTPPTNPPSTGGGGGGTTPTTPGNTADNPGTTGSTPGAANTAGKGGGNSGGQMGNSAGNRQDGR